MHAYWETVLIRASTSNFGILRALIDAGAAMDEEKKGGGSTALTEASLKGYHEYARALVDAGEGVDKVDRVARSAVSATQEVGVLLSAAK